MCLTFCIILLQIPVILIMAFFNITVIAQQQYPHLFTVQTREPAPIYEAQNEGFLGHQVLFKPHNNNHKSYASPAYNLAQAPYSTPAVHNQAKTGITYSMAPLVSHVTFTSLGSTYTW